MGGLKEFKIKPSDVDTRNHMIGSRLRESELEEMVCKLVDYLANNGNEWNVPINLSEIGSVKIGGTSLKCGSTEVRSIKLDESGRDYANDLVGLGYLKRVDESTVVFEESLVEVVEDYVAQFQQCR